ncbi:hypothetical protein [Streptomyces sp. R33]|uniref:Uncharacterized protein n=1 Tax=Streptomyces sp. R33 TaxID=3238629 RepID=A0AB39XW94_9ACTN
MVGLDGVELQQPLLRGPRIVERDVFAGFPRAGKADFGARGSRVEIGELSGVLRPHRLAEDLPG